MADKLTVIVNIVRGDDADALRILNELKVQPNVIVTALREIDLPITLPPPVESLYTATVVGTVNVRDENGNFTNEQLMSGTHISVWSEGDAGPDFHDRAYIDKSNVRRNVWIKNIKKDGLPNP